MKISFLESPLSAKSGGMKMLSLFFLCLALPSLAEETNPWLNKVIPQLVLASGKVYETVKITRIEPDAVTISHEAGIMRIPMEALKPEAQEALGYDPEKAAEARVAAAEAAAEDDEKQLASAALQGEVRALAESARLIRFEVWGVRKDGVEAFGVTYKDRGNPVREKSIHYVEMDTALYDLYEGQVLSILAVQIGTKKVDGRQLRLWKHVPE